jgi:hypothetical protein
MRPWSGSGHRPIETSSFSHGRFDSRTGLPHAWPPATSGRQSGLAWVAVAGISGILRRDGSGGAEKSENRVMVAARRHRSARDRSSGFRAAGNPFSYSDYVDVTPGDGEYVVNLTSYRDLVFAFKQTKFFVFYGNETSSTGTLVPNYRAVDAGVGCACPRGAVAAPEGVYFLDRTGVYLTTGSTPRKVSGPLDPLFGKGIAAVLLPGVGDQLGVDRVGDVGLLQRCVDAVRADRRQHNERHNVRLRRRVAAVDALEPQSERGHVVSDR